MDGCEWMPATKKKKASRNKKRFSDEQIRSLEVIFEAETKLEPKKKVQLARELGLHPRQVAIWFQNKRARWKSKHIEKEYSVLLASYNNLASQFEIMKKEKQSLLAQLQKMKNEGGVDKGKECCVGESDHNSKNISGDDWQVKDNLEVGMVSDDDHSCCIRTDLGLDMEENDYLLRMVEPSSSGDVLDSHDIINQACDETYQWWDFWS